MTITTAGQASGTLATGHDYTTVIPVQLAGSGLLDRLQAAGVQITASVPRSSFGSQVLSWLILLLPLGPVAYPQGGSVFLGSGGPALSSRPFAGATQAAIDAEVARLLRKAEQTAVGLIRAHRAELGSLVDLLLEEETVDGAAVYRIAGRPVPEEGCGETVAPRRVAAAASTKTSLGQKLPARER